MSPYRFRTFSRADLPLAARWLRTAEVVRWWGDSERELALVTQDLDEPATRQWIVEHRGEPFAYVQAYRAGAWPQAHLRRLPADAQMIDAFIGEPAMLGRGHGGAFLSDFARMLIAEGAPVVAIDPTANNHRARRAYDRAGFVGDEIVKAKEGPVAVMVFQQDRADAAVAGEAAAMMRRSRTDGGRRRAVVAWPSQEARSIPGARSPPAR